MKRRDFLKGVGVGAAALALRNVSLQGSTGSEGAVKLELRKRTGDEESLSDPGLGDPVGRAIANTTGSDQLIVGVHLDDAEADTDFDAYVNINGEALEGDEVTLTTDAHGRGNAHLVLEIADYSENTGSIDVQIVVEETAVSYATATVLVALKKKKKKKKKAKKKKKKKK